MKKLQNGLLLLLVMIGLISCENPVDPSKGGSNSFIGEGVQLQIKDVDNCNSCEIIRWNLSSGTNNYQIMVLDNVTSRTVKDYFVIPGNKYKYDIKYYDSNRNLIESAKETITITADKGVGELTSTTKPVASYNSENGIMTFSTLPKFPELIETFINNTPNSSKKFSMYYFLERMGDILYVDNITSTINCTNCIYSWATEAYGKSLRLDGVQASVTVDGVFYGQYLANNDTAGIPQEIIIPDTRTETIIENDPNGIKIILPETSLDYIESIRINKKNITDNIECNQFIMNNTNGKPITKTYYIDYFTEPGKEYSYQVHYTGKNWTTQDITKYSAPLKATNGSGDFGILKDSVTVSYDTTTGIMNLDNLPTKKTIHNKGEYFVNASMCYSDKANGIEAWCNVPKGQSTLNWTTAHLNRGDINNIYNRDLKLDIFNYELYIDNVWYKRSYWREEISNIFKNVPETIKIPDNRKEITLKDHPNGIEIILPDTVPTGADYLTIGRNNVNHPSNEDMQNWYINVADLTKKSIIDYFVSKDEEYEYTVIYRSTTNDGIIERTKTNRMKALHGGVEYLSPKTTVSYDENTTIMSITPKPDISKLPANSTSKLELFYRAPNDNNFSTSFDKDGIINWSATLNNWENYNIYGQPLNLYLIRLEASIDNVSYRQDIWKDDIKKIIPTFPDQITVQDKRAKLILENIGDGVKITLPENLKDVESVTISRWSDDINDSFTIVKRDLNSSNPTTSIIDYFVDPNKEYNYQARFSNANNSISNKTQVSIITPYAGYGEVKIVNCPEATYENNILTFQTNPKVSDNINNLINNKTGYNKIYAHYVHKTGENNWDLSIWSDFENSKVNVLEKINRHEIDQYVNKDFTLNWIRSEINIENVYYTKDFYGNKITHKIPTSIKITDPRANITLEQVSEGIKIVFPQEITNTNLCFIERINKNTNSRTQIEVDNRDTKHSSIIDYFVDPNVDYEYTARYANDWSSNDNFKYSQTKSINSSNSGCGELRISNNPKAKFNQTTHVITVTEAPALDSKIASFISTKNAVETYRLGYAKENDGVWDKTININDTEIYYDTWLEEIKPMGLILEFVDYNVLIGDITFTNSLPLEKFSGFPQRIAY